MTANSKRVVFTMGGKGGVGKTGVMVALAEWFEANEIPATLLDLDTENKARGSLQHFFNGRVTKINIYPPAGLDAFIDHLDGGTPIILADMGTGAGQVAADWFESMYDDFATAGVCFTKQKLRHARGCQGRRKTYRPWLRQRPRSLRVFENFARSAFQHRSAWSLSGYLPMHESPPRSRAVPLA